MITRALGAVLVLALSMTTAFSQKYPDRPVRLVVGFTASPPDTIARLLGQQLQAQMGQPFVVENRLGANGVLGADAVAKAAPDGYTLLVTSASYAVNPSITRSLPFNALEDLIPITNIGQNDGLLLVVTPSLPIKSVAELIDYGKKPDSKLAYGSPGVGNTLHLAAALFSKTAGIDTLHVTYRGAAPAITDLISGQIQMMFLPPSAAADLVKEGKLKALAYTDGKRLPSLPAVPTMAEAGLEKFDFGGAGWYGLFAPAKTPLAIIERLYQEARKAIEAPLIQQRFSALGIEPVGNSPAQFRDELRRSVERFAEIVKLVNIEPQ